MEVEQRGPRWHVEELVKLLEAADCWGAVPRQAWPGMATTPVALAFWVGYLWAVRN